MAALETIDPNIVAALKLLHSSAPDSAEKMRLILDNEIAKTYDKTKLITNLLTKKQLNDEKNAPGSGFKKHKPKKPEEVKVTRAQSPVPIIDESSNEKKSELDELDDELDDYTCVTCRQIDSSANNQLFECIECHLLHHQLCHVPKISNETNLISWICSVCKAKKDKDNEKEKEKEEKEKEKEKEKEGSTKSAKSYESSSSSCSSSSIRKKPKLEEKKVEKKAFESTKKKGSSSSSSSRSRSSRK